MKTKYLKIIKSVMLAICLMLVLSLTTFSVFGDVGNSASHSRSRSFGGFGSGSSRSYSGGGRGIFVFGSSGFGIEEVIGIVVVIAVIYIIIRKRSGSRGGGNIINTLEDMFEGNSYDNSYHENDRLQGFNPQGAEMAIKQTDPNFSKTAFESKVSNMYIQLQEAWMNKNWRAARVFETDELFNVHAKQLRHYVDTHTTNKVDNIAILKCELEKYEDDGVNDVAHVLIKARINDYTINDDTGKVVSGYPKVDIYMTYMWKLIRRKGIVTKLDGKAAQATQCPNCGANVSINASGECEYCGSLVTSGQYDWVLASIEVLEQRNDY